MARRGPDRAKEKRMYAPTTTSEERGLAAICHAASLLGTVLGLGQILIPLIIFVVKGKESPFVADHAREALNFQISMTIYFAVAIVLALLLIGIPLLIGLGIFDFVVALIATIKAANGEHYRYPITMRFVR
jgi:uncharacterized Tic20 family protein